MGDPSRPAALDAPLAIPAASRRRRSPQPPGRRTGRAGSSAAAGSAEAVAPVPAPPAAPVAARCTGRRRRPPLRRRAWLPPSLVDAFAALLAAEERIGLDAVRGDHRAAAAHPPPAPAAPAVTEEMIETVTARVVARLTDQSRHTILDAAERLVREEIERIKAIIPVDKSIAHLNRPVRVPDKPALEGLEAKWMARWEETGVYRFDRTRPRAEVYLGRHAAADRQRLAARRSRLLLHPHRHRRALPAHARQGRLLSDGMGRQRPADRAARAELLRRPLRPVAALRSAFQPPEKPGKQPISVSRPNFIELCTRLTVEDEKAFEALWRYLGLSVDWDMTYATIDKRAQRVSQVSFLRLLHKGHAYQVEAPTLWDVDFRTAVAQAELEDREQPGAYHRIEFARAEWRRKDRDRDDAARTDSCVRRAGRASRRRALQAALRNRGRHAALRRARAGQAARARRSRKRDPASR